MKAIFRILIGIFGILFAAAFLIIGKLFIREKKEEKPWLRGFIIFYASEKIRFEHEAISFKEVIQNLLSGHTTFQQEQSILVWLNAYLMKVEGRPRTASDYNVVTKTLSPILSSELIGYSSEGALRHYLSKQGQDNDAEVIAKMVQESAQNTEFNNFLQMELMRFRLENVFKKIHKQDIQIYSQNMLPEL